MGIRVLSPSLPPSRKTKTRHLSDKEPAFVSAARFADSVIALIGTPDRYIGAAVNGTDLFKNSLLFI